MRRHRPKAPASTRLRVAIVLVIGSMMPGATFADEAENWQRLQTMPRERRVVLDKKLREFDKLPAQKKDAIQALDREVSNQEPGNKSHYLSVMHRYHLWVQTLPEDKQKQLQDAPPEQRMALVTKFRASERPKSPRRPNEMVLQLFGPSPIALARRIQFWRELTPQERTELEKVPAEERLPQQLKAIARKKKLRPIAELSESEEVALEKSWDDDARLKTLPPAFLEKSAVAETKKGIQAKTDRRRRLLEQYRFIVEPPKSVDPGNLEKFADEIPSWILNYDHLPVEEARRRLTILYRLIFPYPEEIPVTKPGTTKDSTAPTAAPAAPKPAAQPPSRVETPPF
ncbi:hypothetical protein ACYOEI_10350 [Singulisphaera rosea]